MFFPLYSNPLSTKSIVVYFSGKVTNSIIKYLNKKGKDLSRLSDWTNLPTEFLRDPTSWLSAHQVENFLKNVERDFSEEFSSNNLMVEIGHSSHELHAWGVLDNVLKIISKPQDIFNQPEMFISYFISPPPPIMNIQKSEETISFDLPISSEEFPCFTTFLKSAFEALPAFMGLDLAEGTWSGTLLKLKWTQSQENLFEPEPVMNPAIMQSIVATLENTEKALESKRRELTKKEEELARIREENEKASMSVMAESSSSLTKEYILQIEKPLSDTRQQMMKLSDYLARSQQLITLLVGQNRMNSQVREAMKRVGWDHIQQEYPKLVSQGVQNLKLIEKAVLELQEGSSPVTISSTKNFEQSDFLDWNPNSFL